MTAPASLFLSPKALVTEVDNSAFTTGVGTLTPAFIGVFQKGPIGTPVLVTSINDAIAKFGTYLPSYYSMYALQQFFQAGGQQCYVVRTAHYTAISNPASLTAASAALTLVDRAGSPLNTLTISALSPGTWGNGGTGGLAVAIVVGVADPTNEFGIVVYYGGVQVETFNDLTMNSTQSNYVENVINGGGSQYITVTDLLSATAAPNNQPALISAPGTSLSGGNDGLSSFANTDITGNQAAQTGIFAFDSLSGAAIQLIAAPGFTGATVANALINYADATVGGRGDLYALIEVPSGQTIAQAVSYRQQTGSYSGTQFNTSYAGLFYPWLKFTDPVTQLPRIFPPAGAIAGAFVRSANAQNPWGAVAGSVYGVISGCIGQEITPPLRTSQNDQLYPYGINAVLQLTINGLSTFCLWGQKTLQIRQTLLNRQNVRMLMLTIEQAILQFANNVLFAPNNQQTRNGLLRNVNGYLAQVYSAQGFDQDVNGNPGYQAICDVSNNPPSQNPNLLNLTVAVIPISAVEFINIQMTIDDGTVAFTEAVTH